MSDIIFQWEKVTKTFPGVKALNNVSISLHAGEVHAIVGENGAGKSTLIHMAAGVYLPDEGSIRITTGIPYSTPTGARHNGVVTVFQESELFDHLSVAENLALLEGLPVNKAGLMNWSQIQQTAASYLQDLPEPIDPRMSASSLSVAQRQILQVASAVAQNAKVLILDEPTSALSVSETTWLFSQIEKLRQQGAAIVYVSHRQEEIFQLSDRISVLRDGKLIWTEPIENVTNKSLVEAMVGRTLDIESQREHSALLDAPTRLEVKNLSDREQLTQNVSLSVKAGEIVGIYGLVGSGRTEFVETIFGIRERVGGDVLVDGKSLQIRSPNDAVASQIGLVTEDRLNQGIFRWHSVIENTVAAALKQLGRGLFTSSAREQAATDEIKERLNVKYASPYQAIENLSGGNQQKVLVGRWLLNDPKVLILDEPTRGVDVGAKEEVHNIIAQLAAKGCTVVFISSELPEVLRYSHRIVVFRDSQISGELPADVATPELVAELAFPAETANRHPLAGAETTGQKSFTGRYITEFALAAISAVLMLILKLKNPAFDFSVLLVNVIPWAILGLSAAVVIIVGAIDISIGSLLGLATAAGGLVMTSGMPPLPAIVIGCTVAVLVAVTASLLNAAMSLWGNVHPIVVTLGMLYAFRGLVSVLMKGESITAVPEVFTWIARREDFPSSLVYGAVIFIAVHIFMSRHRRGRHLYVVGNSETAANLLGIRKTVVWCWAFVLSGVLVALSGLLQLATTTQMQATLGETWELDAIAIAVIGGVSITGGRGTVPGVALGAILLKTLQAVLIQFQASAGKIKLMVGLVILVAITFDHLSARHLARKSRKSRQNAGRAV
ncbi:MAG: hypothetical protein CMJ76_14240 [Planctomycetaceae bacterium]|nr:hypothetical protein [Planctomycetaceae bacterium]|tara:strand:+ start:437 stop:2953 length:2517 start_codon:yes stop_codon:yes gene_type:complete